MQWNCAGQINISIPQKWSQKFFTFNAQFQSVPGVVNPRIQARVLDWNNVVIDEYNQSWGGRRHLESMQVTGSYSRDAATVCNTIWEGAIQLGTACQPV